MVRALMATAAALSLVVLVAACDPASDEVAGPRPGCAETVADASIAVEVDEQVRLLDAALATCRSIDALTAELDRYPSMIGYDPVRFVTERCARIDEIRIRTSPSCAAVTVPSTEAPTTTVAEVVFVGETLDGRRIEIRPDDDIDFVGDVPAVVQQTVDIASEDGCDGVRLQQEFWTAQIDDPAIGDEASVYARHAANVAAFIGCDIDDDGDDDNSE